MRVVSLVPSHTESLHDLGFADQVVGRTRFCIFPQPWVEGIPHVGGTKDADLDKILELKPDLVVVDKDENPLDLVLSLQEAGIDVLHSEIDTVPDAAAFLVELSAALGDATPGEAARDGILQTLEEVGGRDVPVWCPIWHPWMTFDGTAYPSAMLDAVGLRNVFADHDGPKYFEVNGEEVQATEARFTLLPTEPFPFHKQVRRLDLTDLGALGKADAWRIIDGEALTWFGTRTRAGLLELENVAVDLAAHVVE